MFISPPFRVISFLFTEYNFHLNPDPLCPFFLGYSVLPDFIVTCLFCDRLCIHFSCLFAYFVLFFYFSSICYQVATLCTSYCSSAAKFIFSVTLVTVFMLWS
ncbi:unnamed protein product [Calicophoron daubneyi]|uniref:Uncharacterized protein n=1 Tax=Calicophoron daubneyi TaxID=300641 RepID=A0AAV2U1Z2_CALDB